MFWADFWDQVDGWLQKGDQLVIGGDWNELVTDDKFLQPFLSRNLLPAIQQKHGKNLPPTYKRGSRAIDEIFCSSTLQVVQAGYALFGSTRGDHRPLWIDITQQTALGVGLNKPEVLQPKRLRCKDPKVKEKYNFILHQEMDKHGAYHRVHRLLQTFHTPLTPWEEREYEKLYQIRENAMKKAEKECRKLKMGKYEWSPQLQRLRDKLKYMNLTLSRKKGCHVGARQLVTLSKKVKFNAVNWSINKLEKEIYETTGEFRKLRKHHVKERQAYLDTLASRIASTNNQKKLSVIKQLKHVETSRATYCKLAHINKKLSNLSISSVTVSDENVQKRELTDPVQLDEAFREENKQKYH